MNAELAKRGGGQGVGAAGGFRQPIQQKIMEHHGFAIGTGLNVAFNAEIALDRGKKGAARILDDAILDPVQAAMRDWPAKKAGGQGAGRKNHGAY